MKYARILFLTACMIFCMTVVSFASSFQVSNTKYGTITGNGVSASFNENGYNIQMAFVPSGSQMTMYVGKNDDVIYKANFLYHKYLRIDQVYDRNVGKYAYIISAADYMDGDGGLMYLMGYDTQNNSWQIYVNPVNYYNTLGSYAEPHIYVSNGDIVLAYFQMGLHQPAQEYHFFWDENSNWFGYKDYGIVQH